jgi:hypothetical protein
MWWTKEFFTSERTKKMVWDDFLGGHLYEDFHHKQGVLWADIVLLDSPNKISLRGQLFPEFGGPNISMSTIKLIQTGDEKCTFHFQESWIVEKELSFYSSMESGWKNIFNNLKNFVEK